MSACGTRFAILALAFGAVRAILDDGILNYSQAF